MTTPNTAPFALETRLVPSGTGGWATNSGGPPTAGSNSGAPVYTTRLRVRVTSIVPVTGGNANAYNYPADPVNQVDLDGNMARDFGGGSGGGFSNFARRVSGSSFSSRLFGTRTYWRNTNRSLQQRYGRWIFNRYNGRAPRVTLMRKRFRDIFDLHGASHWTKRGDIETPHYKRQYRSSYPGHPWNKTNKLPVYRMGWRHLVRVHWHLRWRR